MKFADGRIWNNIGLDLSLQENRSGNLMDILDYYDYLNEEEQRYLDNIEQTFSEQQIAFLFLLDPLGIEYYMHTNACDAMKLSEKLFFKDRVYKEIFGVDPRLIKVFPTRRLAIIIILVTFYHQHVRIIIPMQKYCLENIQYMICFHLCLFF